MQGAAKGRKKAQSDGCYIGVGRPRCAGSGRCKGVNHGHQSGRERPKPAIDHALPSLRCGPSDRPFAATAKFARGEFTHRGQSVNSPQLHQRPLSGMSPKTIMKTLTVPVYRATDEQKTSIVLYYDAGMKVPWSPSGRTRSNDACMIGPSERWSPS